MKIRGLWLGPLFYGAGRGMAGDFWFVRICAGLCGFALALWSRKWYSGGVMQQHKTSVVGWCLVVPRVIESRWKVPGVPEVGEFWQVKFRLPGGGRKAMSNKDRICPACQAEAVAGRSPGSSRAGCACQKPVRKWAAAEARAQEALWRAGRADAREGLSLRKVPSVSPLTCGEVFEEYLRRVPADKLRSARRAVAACRLMLRELRGEMDVDGLPVTVLSLETGRAWMTLKAAAYETGRPLDELRPLLRAGGLRAPDPTSARRGNTNIDSVLARVKSVVGKRARSHYLAGLRLPLPVLSIEDLAPLRKPAAARWIPEGELWERCLALYEVEGRDFKIAFELMAGCGLRPIEVLAVRGDWLVEDGGRLLLEVRNRGDVFRQKSGDAEVMARYPVSGRLAGLLEGRAGLVFAPELGPSGRDKLLRKVLSKKLRAIFGEATRDTWYALRKLYVSRMKEAAGLEVAATAARHASGTGVTAAHYVAPVVPVLPAVELREPVRAAAAVSLRDLPRRVVAVRPVIRRR